MITRQKIRRAICEMLTNANIPNIGVRVFSNRPTPMWKSELPAICVYCGTSDSGSESAELNSHPDDYARTLQIFIDIVSNAVENVDDVLDLISYHVENIIGKNQLRFARGLVLSEDGNVIENVGKLEYKSCQYDLIGDKSSEISGVCRYVFEIKYYEALSKTDDENYDELKSIHTLIETDLAEMQVEV
jgi:hypothetical protein